MKIGIYTMGTCHTIDKFFQIMPVLDKFYRDNSLCIVCDGSGIADDDLFKKYPYAEKIDIRYCDINNSGLNAIIVIDPYSRPFIPYSAIKIPIIYKEYGVAGSEAGAGYLISKSVYRYADLIITDNNFMEKMILERYPGKKILVGSPAFDFVLDNSKSQSYNIKNILWTPHHSIESKESFDKIEGGTYSNFIQYKDYLTSDFMEEFNDTILHIKYHPILPKRYNYYCKKRGINDTFSRYVKRVKSSKYGSRIFFHNKEDYHDLFFECGVILNDSISFIQEWLPTLKPMIVLRNESKFSEYGEELINDCYFSAYSTYDLRKIYNDLLISKKSDDKYEDRIEWSNRLYIDKSKLSTNSENLFRIICKMYN